jgi:ESCRT-II complex subunit VPS25
VVSTGQLNTILTFYDIVEPAIETPLKGLPLVILRNAITILEKTGRAQLIEGDDGGGARFFTA